VATEAASQRGGMARPIRGGRDARGANDISVRQLLFSMRLWSRYLWEGDMNTLLVFKAARAARCPTFPSSCLLSQQANAHSIHSYAQRLSNDSRTKIGFYLIMLTPSVLRNSIRFTTQICIIFEHSNVSKDSNTIGSYPYHIDNKDSNTI